VIAVRILAVVAAMFLVLAFALGTMLPPQLPLGQAISILNHGWLVAFQDVVRSHISEWVWTNMMVPVLLRPVWLLPTALGLVVGAMAVTVSSRRGPARSHRRRS
jgi:hypothetical protein